MTAAGAAAPQEDTLVAARQQALKEDVERFYLAVVDGGEGLSALEILQQGEYEWCEEIWLFQVIAEFQGLPRSEQRAFRLSQQESQASRYNHVRLIHDVTLQLA